MRLDEAVGVAAATILECSLCGKKKAPWVGLFVPDDPGLWVGGLTPVIEGQTRGIFYRLCKRCKKLPNATELVEERILLQ
jgi:hypothetical protein